MFVCFFTRTVFLNASCSIGTAARLSSCLLVLGLGQPLAL